MNKEDFNLIMDSLENRVKSCKKAFSKVKTTEDLLKMTLEELIELHNFCKNEFTDMTNIAMVDFYHIIGMGDLTPPQMTKFTFAMRDYLKFRPDIKNINKNLNEITKLPQLPTKTKFKLLALCDLTLTQNVRPDDEVIEMEDLDTVKTYNMLHNRGEAAFKICGKNIVVKKEDIEKFFRQIAPVQAHFDNFIRKVNSGSEAFGISWVKPLELDINYVGCLTEAKKQDLIQKFNL